LIKAKSIRLPSLSFIYIREVSEVETCLQHVILMDFGFSIGVELPEYSIILSECIGDVADHIVTITVESIIIDRSAVVATKLLVLSSDKGIATFDTFLFAQYLGY